MARGSNEGGGEEGEEAGGFEGFGEAGGADGGFEGDGGVLAEGVEQAGVGEEGGECGGGGVGLEEECGEGGGAGTGGGRGVGRLGGIGVGRFGTLGRGGRALGEQCGEGSGQRGDATGDVGHERLGKGFILPVRPVWAGRGRYSVGEGKRMQVFAVDVVDGRVEAICQWWGGEGTVGNRDRAVL